MHGVMHTWDWFWMGFMVVTWVVVVGAIVYVAVRLATHPHHGDGHPS